MPVQLPPPPHSNTVLDRWLNLLWRKFSADGEIDWDSINFTGSNLTDLETREHNSLQNIQGAVTEDIFEATAFEPTAFQLSITNEAYHVTAAMLDELNRLAAATTVSASQTMTSDYSVYIVDTSAVELTLPAASSLLIGEAWTVVQDVVGFVDVSPNTGNEIILRGGSDTIRLRQIGSTVTLKCVTTTQWVIV